MPAFSLLFLLMEIDPNPGRMIKEVISLAYGGTIDVKYSHELRSCHVWSDIVPLSNPETIKYLRRSEIHFNVDTNLSMRKSRTCPVESNVEKKYKP
jgi:hypothetical protein